MAPAVDVSSWHPALQELYRYWCAIHPGDALPGRQHLDPVDLCRFLPRVWLLDVQREPFRLRYRLVGTHICEMAGRELTGQWLDEAHPAAKLDPSIFGRFQQVAATGLPIRRRGKPKLFLRHKADFTEIENAVFPLASDGKTVDMILAYTIFYGVDGKEI